MSKYHGPGVAGGLMTGLFTPLRYYTTPSAARTTAPVLGGAGAAVVIPFWVGKLTTFDRIGVNVTTNVAATTVRLGVYRDNSNGSPNTLVVDAGTVDSATVGAKEITISQALAPGLYWLCAVPQGGSPTLQALSGAEVPVGAGTLATATGASSFAGMVTAGAAVAGALPTTFPAIADYTATPPVIALRAA